jgi:hypothetical protein
MFQPNQTAQIQTVAGRNFDGEEIYSDPTQIQLAIVHLVSAAQRTSVRSDSSASRGQANEMAASGAKFLSKQQVGVDDLIIVAAGTFRVLGTHPRFSVFGQLDHYEIMVELVDE